MKTQRQDNRTIGAFVLIGIGVMLLMGIKLLWALFIFTPGLALLAASRMDNDYAAPLAIPGMLIAGTGGILLFQSITGYWESWAFAWTLYAVFLGAGLKMFADRMNDRPLGQIGKGLMYVGGIAFGVLGFFFILITNAFIGTTLPFALIVGGIYLLWKNDSITFSSKSKNKAKRYVEFVQEDAA